MGNDIKYKLMLIFFFPNSYPIALIDFKISFFLNVLKISIFYILNFICISGSSFKNIPFLSFPTISYYVLIVILHNFHQIFPWTLRFSLISFRDKPSLFQASLVAGKEFVCNVGDLGLIPELGRSPGEGSGYPLQYSVMENSRDCL